MTKNGCCPAVFVIICEAGTERRVIRVVSILCKALMESYGIVGFLLNLNPLQIVFKYIN